MTVRRYAKCTSSLPTDEILTEDGEDFIQMPGRPLAGAIAEDFRNAGFIVDGPESAGLNGWSAIVKYKGRSFWFEITLIDDYYLSLGEPSFWRSLFGRDQIFIEFMKEVGMALRDDPRIENLRWYMEFDDGSESAQYPVTE